MGTICVTSNVTFRAFTGILPAEGEHVSTMATPVSSNIGERLEPMGNTMVDLLLVALLKKNSDINNESTTIRQRHTPVLDLEMHLVTTFS